MLIEVARGDNFIIETGDDLPFDGKLERIARIVELIDKHGRVPIQVLRQCKPDARPSRVIQLCDLSHGYPWCARALTIGRVPYPPAGAPTTTAQLTWRSRLF